MRIRTSNWTGVGGIRTPAWKRESTGSHRILYRDGLRRVGTSGTTSTPEPVDGLAGDEKDTRCRFCVAKVHHECQKNSARPDGNGAEVSSRTSGYTQQWVWKGVKGQPGSMRLELERVPKVKRAKRKLSKAEILASLDDVETF